MLLHPGLAIDIPTQAPDYTRANPFEPETLEQIDEIIRLHLDCSDVVDSLLEYRFERMQAIEQARTGTVL